MGVFPAGSQLVSEFNALPAVPFRRGPSLLLTAGLLLFGVAVPQGAQAQVQKFILQPGSEVGPSTTIKPKNCVTAADGSITCDTQIENKPGDTPARPHYSPFSN